MLCAILPKWFLPTRLETRTKESNIYASIWVSNPICAMKVIRWDWASLGEFMHHRPVWTHFYVTDLSKSISVRTRKMVNYA